MPFAHVRMSGSRFHRELANQSPTRPNPVMTSSATKSTPASRQIARTSARYPSGGANTPPAPITGSQKKAATRSGPAATIASWSAAGESQAIFTTSPTSGPWPAAFASIPARLVPATCIPWYACSRVTRSVRSVSPRSCQYRRAIFVAVSIESDPPLVRKTFESRTGASPPRRSASSIAGRFDWSPKVEYADRRTICRCAASAISSRP